MNAFAVIAAVAWAMAPGSAFAGQLAINSPGGHAEIRIEDDASRFSVLRHGETVIAPSPLGLELDGAPAFGALALESREDIDRILSEYGVPRVDDKGAPLPSP